MRSTTVIDVLKVEPADLVDANEVAELIGLSRGSNVSLYRRRYADFPTPVVEKGRCLLWLRQDVVRWAARRPRR